MCARRLFCSSFNCINGVKRARGKGGGGKPQPAGRRSFAGFSAPSASLAVSIGASPAKYMPPVRIPPRSLKVFLFGFLALALFTGWTIQHDLHKGEYWVVGTYWASGEAANHHQNPYAALSLSSCFYDLNSHLVVDVNLNPPLLLLLFQPLALLSETSAFVTWTVVSFLLFISTTAFIVWNHESVPDACILMMLLGAPILDTLRLGQLYALIYVLAAVAWWGLEKQRTVTASVAIGILVAIKPMLVLWPVFLALSGKRRIAAFSSIVAFGASVLPIWIYGYRIFVQWFAATQNDQHYSVPFDISIPAFFRRLGHDTLGYVIAAALLAILAGYTFRTKPNVQVTSGIAVSASLLCSPLAWLQYILLVFPVIATAPAHRLRNLIVVLISVPTYFPGLIATAPDHRRILGQLFFFAPCCLLLAWFMARSLERGPEGLAT